MIYALFVFTACVIASCVSIALRKPSQAEVLLIIPFSLSGVGFACQAFPSWIDREIGITNGSDIAHHCLAVITMTSSLLFTMTLKPPRRVSNKTLLWSASFSGVLMVLVVLQWLDLPGRSIESPSDASGWQTLHEPFAPVTVVYLAYMVVGFVVLAWQCIWGAKARFTDLPAARRGSFTMGVGIVPTCFGSSCTYRPSCSQPAFFFRSSVDTGNDKLRNNVTWIGSPPCGSTSDIGSPAHVYPPAHVNRRERLLGG
jgi:hypothetical protein